MKNDLEDYFVPTKRNNYAPHSLQKAAMFGMLALVIISFTISNVHSLLWISSQWMVSTILPSVIVDLTNSQRQGQALGTLRRSSVLDEAARMKAQHMAANEYFAHHSPDGVSPWFWFGRANYNFVHAGENLAIHFTDSSDVVKAWMESPTHRANIMNGNYAEIGVGTAEGTYDGFSTVYVVQLFGTPAAVASAPQERSSEQEALAVAETQQEEAVLSESVSITEEVVTYEAQPVAVAVEEEEPEAEEAAVVQEEQAAPASSTPNTVVITDMESTPYGVALYSDFISTSTGGVPATIVPTGSDSGDNVPFFLTLATQPHTILQILYAAIGLFVLISLLISIFIEVRHQRPVQILYGSGLLAVMGLLYYIHMLVSNGALIA